MRTGEPVYAELALDVQTGDALLDAIARHPPSCWSGQIFIVGSGRSSPARPKTTSSSSEPSGVRGDPR